MFKFPAFALLAGSLLAVPANASCPETHDLKAMNACASKESSQAKAKMDQITKMFAGLSMFDQKAFKASQAAFLGYTKEHCALEGSLLAKGGAKYQVPSTISLCEAKMYKGRVTLLQSTAAMASE